MKLKPVLIPVFVVLAVAAVVAWAARSPVGRDLDRTLPVSSDEIVEAVRQVDQHFLSRWKSMTPAEPADELLILRRLSLSLDGTVPSLEEIRDFEADVDPDRLNRWTVRLLADTRFAEYLAERLARSFVGTEKGTFIIFRRDRFVGWLSDQLKENRPYNEIVVDLISEQGLWTGTPATNFITAALNDGDLDENKLAGRCVRAFLGQRINCAQCHDHPFEDWKQNQFEGLAAHFGQTRVSIVGVEDKQVQDGEPVEYKVEDREPSKRREVSPAVPFHPEWLPETGTRRHRLAVWITHPENRRFERTTVNRMWGLLFGKPYSDPVDDLPDPGDLKQPDLLDILGADFREHGYDLRRLFRVMAASQPFRLASSHACEDPDEFKRLKSQWAVFPLTRLRPEQVIGSMLQAASLKTIDQNSHLLVRAIRFFHENEFVEEYGDLGENELDERSGTIPQALLRMNGRLSQKAVEADLFSSSARIASMAGSDKLCLETTYLVCLSRRPTPAEQQYFLAQLHETTGKKRQKMVEDIFWSLLNSPEFSWDH